jgi:hypothetical protein
MLYFALYKEPLQQKLRIFRKCVTIRVHHFRTTYYIALVSLSPHKFVCPPLRYFWLQKIMILGILVMMGRDWRLRTAASTGLLFIPRWFAMWTMMWRLWWYWLRLTPNLSTGALCQPPVLSGVLPTKTNLAATSTGWRSCQQRYLCQPPVGLLSAFLTSEASLERVGGGRRKWEFSLSIPVGLSEIFYMP